MLYYYRKHYGFFVYAWVAGLLYGFHNPVLSVVRFFKRKLGLNNPQLTH